MGWDKTVSWRLHMDLMLRGGFHVFLSMKMLLRWCLGGTGVR